MPKRWRTSDDYDSPWKEALQRFLRAFLEFFFPHIAADIDWSRGYESLDKEFQQIIRRAKLGKAVADKLFKVYLRDGSEHWLLIHVEVQGEREPKFPERMFRYNVAAYSLYNREVVSLALLTDDDRGWRPRSFAYGRWGCRTGIRYLVAKLLDFLDDPQALETSTNPIAAVVLAHGQARATRSDPPTRRLLKFQLVKRLYQRGWEQDEIRDLFRVIDWIMDLPEPLADAFRADLYEYEQERAMRYVTSIERLAHKEGEEKGLKKGVKQGRKLGLCDAIAALLESRFGSDGHNLMHAIRAIENRAALKAILLALPAAETLDDVHRLLPKPPRTNGQ